MILQSPTSFAHSIWPNLLSVGSIIIDATCGNGHDTLYLAQKVLGENKGRIFAFDIQKKAIENTEALLKKNLQEKLLQRVQLIHGCHSQIESHCPKDIDLIVFNLGYLPGADKSLTTLSETTLMSVQSSLSLLKNGGHLSIMCYPGHAAGEIEAEAILKWATNLSRDYCTTQHSWINRSKKAPFLLLINKK